MARPFIPVPFTLKIELRYTCFGQKIENVVYFSRVTQWTEEDAQAMGAGLVNWFDTNMAGVMPPALSLNAVRMTNMESASAFAMDYTTGLPIAGEAESPPLPMNVTASIKLSTAGRGRSYTGRSYWPVMLSNYVTGNTLTPVARTNIKNAWEALRVLSPAGTFGANLSVVSFTTNGALRTEGITTNVTAVSVDENVDSQRRRLTGRGQ
jgi:hypothetical protein